MGSTVHRSEAPSSRAPAAAALQESSEIRALTHRPSTRPLIPREGWPLQPHAGGEDRVPEKPQRRYIRGKGRSFIRGSEA